jgi:uncharacterized membrane protein
MMLSKKVFIMIVALILVLYGVANVALFRMSGDNYVQTDLFFIITSIFAFMSLVSLPRIVEILLGSESRVPNHEIYGEEMSDAEYDS